MSNIQESLADVMTIDGVMCSALVDANSGMMLGSAGSGVDLYVAAAGNTEVVRAKMKTMSLLKLSDSIEDILITLGKQYHIIRPLAKKQGLFLYVVLDKSKSNLALARRKCQEVADNLGREADLKRLGLDVGSDIRVVVVMSGAGGTGSGAFIDAGYADGVVRGLPMVKGEHTFQDTAYHFFPTRLQVSDWLAADDLRAAVAGRGDALAVSSDEPGGGLAALEISAGVPAVP